MPRLLLILCGTALLASAQRQAVPPPDYNPPAQQQSQSAPTASPSQSQQDVSPAQEAQPHIAPQAKANAPSDEDRPKPIVDPEVTLPAGTRVDLKLLDPISTKTARVGDSVYLSTSFPVTQDNRMVIPAGTYVKGSITDFKRPGRIKGRAEIRFRFDKMIFPSGYTVNFPGALQNLPASEDSKIKDEKGTIQANGTKGRDAATIAGTAAGGTIIGAEATRSLGGAGIGAGIGAAAGTLITLITRGNEVRLEPGTSAEMVFERPVTIDLGQAGIHDYASANWQQREQYPGPPPRIVRERRRLPMPGVTGVWPPIDTH